MLPFFRGVIFCFTPPRAAREIIDNKKTLHPNQDSNHISTLRETLDLTHWAIRYNKLLGFFKGFISRVTPPAAGFNIKWAQDLNLNTGDTHTQPTEQSELLEYCCFLKVLTYAYLELKLM